MEPMLWGEAASRLVGRHAAHHFVASAIRWRAALDLDMTSLIVVRVALIANLAPVPPGRGGGLLAADDARRPVALLGIAASMDVPYETIRRQSLTLAERGVLVRHDAGWIVPAAALAPAAPVMRADSAGVATLLTDLAAMHYGPALAVDPARIGDVADDVVARLWNDFATRISEGPAMAFGDRNGMYLCIAIIRANVAHIAADPARSRRHASHDAPPDDSERRPVGLRELARSEELPYATVRRRVTTLIERGIVEPRGDGVIVPARVVTGDLFAAIDRKIVGHLDTLIADLSRLTATARGRAETAAPFC